MANEMTVKADPERKDAPSSIGGQLPFLSTGERAQLRRMFLTKSVQAEGLVVKLLLKAGVTPPDDPQEFASWKLLAHIAALLSGTAAEQPHALERRVGTALHATGYSENRLLRLTAARGQPLEDQIIRAARMLAQAGQAPVNLWTFFDLAGNRPDRAEAARIRIAQDYYAAEARQEGEAK